MSIDNLAIEKESNIFIGITKYPAQGPVTHFQVTNATLGKMLEAIGASSPDFVPTPSGRQLIVGEGAEINGKPKNERLSGLFGFPIYGDGIMVDLDELERVVGVDLSTDPAAPIVSKD